jgi:hypothetical protein
VHSSDILVFDVSGNVKPNVGKSPIRSHAVRSFTPLRARLASFARTHEKGDPQVAFFMCAAGHNIGPTGTRGATF